MKKPLFKIALLAFATLFAGVVKSQVSFNHSLGVSTYFALSTNATASGYGIMYSPRLNFLELADETTLSVGTHLGLGFSGSANSQSGSSGSFLLDAPLMVELNFGQAANPDASSSFGGFGGIGYGFNAMAQSSNTAFGNSSSTFSASGIVFNGGLRAVIRDRSVGARVSYMLNMTSGGANVIGIGVFYTFGMN
ncbi:MAG: hypothetical protein H7296_10050 [Bacteroidia bacterium]|nr:hypothetical protein [Bacteroidia bacterium]